MPSKAEAACSRPVQERDAFLQTNKQELETAKNEKETELSAQRDTLANLRRTVEKETADIAKLQQDVTKKAAAQQDIGKQIDDKKRQRLQLHENRKQDWRKMEELQESVREAREVLHSSLSDTKKVMPRATAMGLEALKTIVEQEGLRARRTVLWHAHGELETRQTKSTRRLSKSRRKTVSFTSLSTMTRRQLVSCVVSKKASLVASPFCP